VRDDALARDNARAAAALQIDAGRSNIVCAVGTKGSGKSEACRAIFEAWPFDRLVIDVTGDARPTDPATIALRPPLKSQLPDPDVEQGQTRVTAWVKLDPQRATYVADQDDALALGLYPQHRDVLVWVDEYAQMATPTKLGPNLRLALQSSRHYHTSMLLAFPRPRFIPVMTLAQADKVFIFRVPNKNDRQLIAENIGFPVPDFEDRYSETMARGDHSFLLWDSRQTLLVGCPALPLRQTHGPPA
jgi:hypothetical protein